MKVTWFLFHGKEHAHKSNHIGKDGGMTALCGLKTIGFDFPDRELDPVTETPDRPCRACHVQVALEHTVDEETEEEADARGFIPVDEADLIRRGVLEPTEP